MKQRPRIYYTESQKQQMWDHWQYGAADDLFTPSHLKSALSISHDSPLTASERPL